MSVTNDISPDEYLTWKLLLFPLNLFETLDYLDK